LLSNAEGVAAHLKNNFGLSPSNSSPLLAYITALEKSPKQVEHSAKLESVKTFNLSIASISSCRDNKWGCSFKGGKPTPCTSRPDKVARPSSAKLHKLYLCFKVASGVHELQDPHVPPLGTAVLVSTDLPNMAGPQIPYGTKVSTR